METLPKHPIAAYRAKHKLSQEQFGNLVNVQKPAVCKWEDNSGPSPQKALEIEKATAGELTKEVLRPDIYPQETRRTAKQARAS